ncbi:MAG: phage holin family protein [Candidatus Thermoplasmatota archaeon]
MKIPKLYILTIIVLAFLGAFIFCLWFGVITFSDLQYLYALLSTFILGWIVVILFAIIGAVFVGMYLSHRILLTKDFTPFEKSMLEMKEDIAEIKKKLDSIEGKSKH